MHAYMHSSIFWGKYLLNAYYAPRIPLYSKETVANKTNNNWPVGPYNIAENCILDSKK